MTIKCPILTYGEYATMHTILRLIVSGDNADEALENAVTLMDTLVDSHEYDWYAEASNESRWEHCWEAMPLDSQQGLAWIDEAMRFQFADFKRSMETIRTMIAKFTDEQIFEQDFSASRDAAYSRWLFRDARGYYSSSCTIWDESGSAVTNRNDLDYYLKDPRNAWVVQVDAHN